jgi:ribosomal-protein-alanine N-acetyltransferase
LLKSGQPIIILPVEVAADGFTGGQQRVFREESGMNPQPTIKTSVHIRWMIRRDMPEVLAIEQQSFEFPWSEEDFIRCLRQRNCIGMVAEHHERVVGSMIYELHRNRLHVLNFAVSADMQRRGIGSQMMKKLASKLSPQRRNRIMLEVRETNLPAQLFFRQQNFRAISLLRDFYEDTTEDAYLMQYRYVANPAEVEGLGVNRISRLAG